MTQIFTAFLLTSVTGTILALILLLLRPLTRKIFSASWHYYMWLVILFVMLLPIKINLPEEFVSSPPVIEQTATITNNHIEYGKTPVINQGQYKQNITQKQDIQNQQDIIQKKVSPVQTFKNFLSSKLHLFSYIWLAGTLLLFMVKLISYFIFLIKMHKRSKAVSFPEIRTYTNRKIKTRISDTICSPLIIGIIKPTLLLPGTEVTPQQLHNILSHEMTHLKRNDILYKWFVNIIKCIHWFNPVIYYVANQINIDCEISCDLSVVKDMNEQQTKEYAETILSLLTHNNSKAVPLTTGMTGTKKILKRRFIMIKKRKSIGKIAQLLSAVLSVAILASSLFASGVLATKIFKEDTVEAAFEVEVIHNGYLLHLENKPFSENGTVYLPLRELLEKTGLLSDENCYINWNSGKITLCIAEGENAPDYDELGNQIGNKPIIIQYYYGLEIGKAEYILNPEQTLPSHRQNLSQRVEMINAPVLKNNVAYIPYEYVDYMINRITINHEITIESTSDNTVKPAITNMENMTYEDIRNLQISVDNGHFPWRLEPEQVIMSFLSGNGVNVESGKITALAGGGSAGGVSATYSVGDKKYSIELFQPIDKTDNGIWVVKSFQENKDPFLKEISFYDTTPGERMIEKQEDGWYRMPETVDASFPWFQVGEKYYPTSVVAYFTPSGTQMEEQKKEVGKITPPYTYRTMAQVLSMRINFSKEDTIGHLWFVFNFEDGSSEISEIYNIYKE